MENCVICGKEIVYNEKPWNIDTWHPRKYCSYDCIKKSKNMLRKIRVEKTHSKTCMHCHEKFTSKRADTEYCSNKCKQAEYRQRKAGPKEAKKIKVIVITGDHCRACKEFKATIEEFLEDPDFVTYNKLFSIEYLNVDENQELAYSYNEELKKSGMYLPSVVLLKPDGKQFDFFNSTPKIGEMMQSIVKEINLNKQGVKIELPDENLFYSA